jgi:hypothetical protein
VFTHHSILYPQQGGDLPILPPDKFSLVNAFIQDTVHAAIEMFTGGEVKAEFVKEFINNPANALNLQSDAHESMDKYLAWGIEAKLDGDKVKVMRLCTLLSLI